MSTKATDLRTVMFHDDEIITFESGGVRYVAMRRIVENIGLAWQSQHAKLLEQRSKFSCNDIVTTGADGKEYAMVCMPVGKLPLWLACINPNKVTDRDPAVQAAKRARIERYQAECAIALHDYWTKGAAKRASPGASDNIADRNSKRLLVGECRKTFGLRAAQVLWFQLELETNPEMMNAHRPETQGEFRFAAGSFGSARSGVLQ